MAKLTIRKLCKAQKSKLTIDDLEVGDVFKYTSESHIEDWRVMCNDHQYVNLGQFSIHDACNYKGDEVVLIENPTLCNGGE